MTDTISICNTKIGPGQPAFIIAEIGSNHDGDLEQAKALINAAAKAGANAVKFQSFTASGLLNPIKIGDGGQQQDPVYNVLEKLELPVEWHSELKQYADNCGVMFLSASFDRGRAELLNQIDVPAFKIASSEITNLPFLQYVAKLGKPIILSTGMAYLDEVGQALRAIYETGNRQVILLHCVANYPPRFADANIRAMLTMAAAFNVPAGYSDHFPGDVVSLAAVALGARVIEKHITPDRNLPGPDHSYALEIPEFTEMISKIRNLEPALGTGEKVPTAGEMPVRLGAFRSIYAAVDIPEGAKITPDMLKCVRPGGGLPAEYFNLVVGRIARADIKAHEKISWEKV